MDCQSQTYANRRHGIPPFAKRAYLQYINGTSPAYTDLFLSFHQASRSTFVATHKGSRKGSRKDQVCSVTLLLKPFAKHSDTWRRHKWCAHLTYSWNFLEDRRAGALKKRNNRASGSPGGLETRQKKGRRKKRKHQSAHSKPAVALVVILKLRVTITRRHHWCLKHGHCHYRLGH